MEWSLAAGATGWGAILIESADGFARPFYAPLARIAPAWAWAWGMCLLGALGLVVLFINGAWRRTPLLRQVSSFGRMLAWSGLFYGCLSVDWHTPASMIYAMIFGMEVMAFANAAADGQRMQAGTYGH